MGKTKRGIRCIADEENLVEPTYLPVLNWCTKEDIKLMKEYGGKRTIDVVPENARILNEQVEGYVKILKERGIKVHRNIPLRYPD